MMEDDVSDDSNPMHRIGYGRGDDLESKPTLHKPRVTQAYSMMALIRAFGRRLLNLPMLGLSPLAWPQGFSCPPLILGNMMLRGGLKFLNLSN